MRGGEYWRTLTATMLHFSLVHLVINGWVLFQLGRTGLRADDVRVLPPHTLPKTTSGKIQRRKSRSLYLEGKLTPRAAAGKSRSARTT